MSNKHLLQIVLVLILRHGQGKTNFALHKPAIQSSILDYIFLWNADKAVDGNTNGLDPDNSRTCSSTQQSQTRVNNTWEVNIGFPIIMKTITVYGRTDGNIGYFKNDISLYLGNRSGPSIYILKNERLSNITRYVYTPKDMIASVVSLMKMGQIMVICEVTIDGECLDGMFSESCNETCGKCFSDELCNKRDGSCPSGCNKGWKGPLCKEACERGKYGYACNSTCGKCLYGIDSCSTSNGKCVNGCQAGWQGLTCDKECVAGTYGLNCIENCGHCLDGPNNCSNIDGLCTGGCEAGWRGEQCKQECVAGTYGLNCIENCGHCLDGPNNCSNIDGLCTGRCEAGWRGEQCKQGTEGMSRPGDVPHFSVIVGSVAAAVGVSVFVIAIIVFIVKKRKKTNNERRAEELTTVPEYANLVVGNPDADFKITDRSKAEKGPNVHARSDYEQLQDFTRPPESTYSTINTDSVPTLQSVDEDLKI